MIEHLESRRLMSAGASVAGGNLVVRGTAGDDVVRIRHASVSDITPAEGFVTLGVRIGDGPERLFDVRRTGRITVRTGAGNDVVLLGGDPLDPSAGQIVPIPTSVRATVD